METNGKIDLADVRRRIVACRDAMEASYRERADAIEACWLGALAQEHVLLLGPPGTGKSHLLSGLTACVSDARMFSTLLTKFSTEDEVCGPLKLSELKNHDRAVRNTDGALPGVEIGFVDEVFKANSAVLNSLLSIMNERRYKGALVPLRLMVAASNEMPEDDSLGAMYDRFLVRHVVDYIRGDAARLEYHRAKANGTLRAFVPPATFTLAEWDAARAAVEAVPVPDAVIEQVCKLQAELAAKSIVISDRRIGQCYGLLKAAAWLDECATVEMDHVMALRHALWLKQDDVPTVKSLLDTIDLGPAREALRVIDDALRAYQARPTDAAAYHDRIPTLVADIAKAAKRVQAYEGKVSKRAWARIIRGVQDLRAAHVQLKADLEKRLGSV